jgi:hypothetical protein
MANVALTEQRTFNWEHLRAEQGRFVVPAADFTVETKLRNILYFKPQLMEDDSGAGSSDVTLYLNSASASTTEDDQGIVFFDQSTMTENHVWTYLAIGK